MSEGFNNLFQEKSSVEGFADMSGLFNTILKSGTATSITRPACSQSATGDGSNCPPTTSVGSTQSSTSGDTATTTSTPTAFLKTIINQEKATMDSLMDTAKRINPVAQTINPKPAAYDAAFEGNTPAALPRAGATLQGFAIILLIVSFIALTMVSTIAVNNVTQNAYSAGKTFIAFIIGGVILLSLITRLG
jgi:hypothetical protein